MKSYTTGEVAKVLQVSTVTVRNEIERGNLIAYKVGADYRITQQRLDEYMGIDQSWEKERTDLLKRIEEQERLIVRIRELMKDVS